MSAMVSSGRQRRRRGARVAPDAVLRDAGVALGRDYPRPVVEHAAGRRRALDAFAAMRKEAAAA